MRCDVTLPGFLGALLFVTVVSVCFALVVRTATSVAITLSTPRVVVAGGTPEGGHQ